MATDASFDLGEKLRQRLRETNMEKEKTQIKINKLADELQRRYSKNPKRPRETAEQLDEKIKKLEFQRTTNSHSLAEEKKILREIKGIERTKAQLEEFNVNDAIIQEKKIEQASLKDHLRTLIAAVAELEAALSKVELAKRLGCTPADLQSRVIDCPSDKMGQVIGKNGATLKQIEDRTGVQVDVDKVGNKIHLTGSDASLGNAVEALENITLAIEKEAVLDQAVLSYLTFNRMDAFSRLQKAHPAAYFDLNRKNLVLNIRGRPEVVEAAMADLEGMDITGTTRELTNRETRIVVGKSGATINELTSVHAVVINLESNEDSSSRLEIAGPPANVEKANAAVDDLLYNNEDIEESIVVEHIVRSNLLGNSATLMKELQKEINASVGPNTGSVLLTFERFEKGEIRAESNLIIRGARTNMSVAREIVEERIKAIEATVSVVRVDPDIIPIILGKGGATIKHLAKEAGDAELDIDKVGGRVRIQTDDEEVRKSLTESIQKIIDENQVGKVPIEKNLIGILFGEPGKELRTKCLDEMGVKMMISDDEKNVLIRGTTDSIEEASVIVNEFIQNNYTEELDVDASDEMALVIASGGANFLQQTEKEFDIKAVLRKSRHVVSIRGKRENVTKARESLSRFLFGGDGFAVCKLNVTDATLGVVIGKGGSNLQKLETEYEGLTLNVQRSSNQLVIRGPEELVAQCRVDVVKAIATARVTETITINSDEHEKLSQANVVRKLTDGMAVQVTVSESVVKFRGTAVDVRDAKAAVQELLTGKYEARFDLEASQFSKVKKAVQDSAPFDRIRTANNVSIDLDSSKGSILISGKRSHVKKAKIQIMGFLDFLLPMEFARVKVAKPLLRAMSDTTKLAEVAANSGASVFLDRDSSSIHIQGSNPDDVAKAVEIVKANLVECENLAFIMKFEPSDSWLIPKIIGKGGETVQQLQEKGGCKVDVSRDELTVSITAESEEAVEKAKQLLLDIVQKERNENVFVDIPESAMPSFIGKGGGNIKQIAETTGAEIERVRKDPNRLHIKGSPTTVEAASKAIAEWLKNWESKNAGVTIPIEDSSLIPAIIGKSGATIDAVQKEHSVRVDLDRRALKLTIRGGSEFQRNQAIKRIDSIMEEEKTKAMERAKEAAKVEEKEFAEKEQSSAPKNESQQKPKEKSQEERKDRSGEFAARPVGMSAPAPQKTKSVKSGAGKKSGSNGHSNRTSSYKGSAASRGLFDMLSSDQQPEAPQVPAPATNGRTGGRDLFNLLVSPAADVTPSLIPTEDAMESSTSTAETGEEVEEVKPTYKSVSGFRVRV